MNQLRLNAITLLIMTLYLAWVDADDGYSLGTQERTCVWVHRKWGRRAPVVAMLGRATQFHPYKGFSLATVVYPIRVLARLGAQDIIIVVIRDHLALPNLTGFNPLLGPPTSLTHPRFLPLSSAYSPALARLAFLASASLSLPRTALAEGTYAWVSGPTYETPAEGRLLRAAGADVVGMSTVPEVVAAREEGVNVLVLSLVTNKVVIPERYRSIKEEVETELAGKPVELPQVSEVSHEEVLSVGRENGEVMRKLVERIVEQI